MDFFYKLLSDFAKWITDKSVRVSTKIATVIITITGLLIINNITGFTDFYKAERKIANIERLSKLINDPVIDSQTKVYAIGIRTSIMERKNIVDYAYLFLKNVTSIYSKNPNTNITNPAKNNINYPCYKYLIQHPYI